MVNVSILQKIITKIIFSSKNDIHWFFDFCTRDYYLRNFSVRLDTDVFHLEYNRNIILTTN